MKIDSILDIKKSDMSKMTEDQTKILMTFLMAKEDDKKFNDLNKNVIEESFIHQVFIKRLEWVGIKDKVEKKAMMFLGFIMPNLGASTLWAYALYRLSKEHKKITLNLICEEFPWGFPSSEQYEKYWDKQKGYVNEDLGLDCDNVLDQKELYV